LKHISPPPGWGEGREGAKTIYHEQERNLEDDHQHDHFNTDRRSYHARPDILRDVDPTPTLPFREGEKNPPLLITRNGGLFFYLKLKR
jgi:hypothetical protein